MKEQEGMTNLQFKSWIRSLLRTIERIEEKESLEEIREALGLLSWDLKEDLRR